jgi:hypothetical protein
MNLLWALLLFVRILALRKKDTIATDNGMLYDIAMNINVFLMKLLK